MASTYYIAWWNLENLFDSESSPRRTDKLQRAIGADLAGWTADRRDRKVAQLASVITQMNGGAGPDLLGVCEVENRFVLDLLVAALGSAIEDRTYGVIHADTNDARGIDVAFIYDTMLFTVPPGEVFSHVVMRRNATRDIVQVNFRTHRNRTWSVFGNHWPFFHERALDVHGADTPVLAMGDFNDEPFDPSLVIHAVSTRQRERVVEADKPRFWNLTWPVIGDPPDGTFYFNNEPNALDQFLVNKNMATRNAPIRVDAESIEILCFPGTFSTGKYPQPKPFGGMGKPLDENGFSDHFPVGLRVTEID
jgi:predicted extracellular nuclease